MGKVAAVCISTQKGVPKEDVGRAVLLENHGLEGDVHAGSGHRQVSLLSKEKIDAFRTSGADVGHGAFGENLVVSGINLRALNVGTRLCVGTALLEITQIGKDCHNRCAIFERAGDCIMPREGVFAKVLRGGEVAVGHEVFVEPAPYRLAVITVSDKCFSGERTDQSGPSVQIIAAAQGFFCAAHTVILPDEQALLEAELIRLCDNHLADLILTTGGTGFSPRDVTPEATLAVAHRNAPGISQAILAHSLEVTKRAMLSRAASVIRERTLIVNLPGSPKAVREILPYILPELTHGLDILTGRDGECANNDEVC